MPPETIAGRYRVEREVGRGGMGSVWLCRDELLGRVVAVKQVGRLPGESTPDLARAMREARSSAALNHRNVVAVYDAIEEGDHIWLVMEYVPGRTLSQIVAADGPLPPERAAWIGAQVADGLAAAHARGTVHRDVKPGNILVTDDDVAKISDFGIARTHGDATLTQSGMVTGTPAYFSPELARGDEASPASDVWALGATLYAAVEGHGPYPDQPNALALLSTIAAERPHGAGACRRAGRADRPDDGPRPAVALGDGRRLPRAAPDPRPERRGRDPRGAPAGVRAGDHGAAGHDRGTGDGGRGDHHRRAPRRRRRRPATGADAAGRCSPRWPCWPSSRPSGSCGGPPPRTSPRPVPDRRRPSAARRRPAARRTPAARPRRPRRPSPSTPRPRRPRATPARRPASAKQFVTGYYGLLPDDTKSGWAMLSSGFQKDIGSYGKYRGLLELHRLGPGHRDQRGRPGRGRRVPHLHPSGREHRQRGPASLPRADRRRVPDHRRPAGPLISPPRCAAVADPRRRPGRRPAARPLRRALSTSNSASAAPSW